jgi:prepilin-type N-terminal cleavage/methylation domain-containing protein
MNNNSGFTLVELLLVVAILAIVAAAASPTFFAGAQEALAEARKAPFLSAYQNAVSGANTALSTALTRGEMPDESGVIPRFTDYTPISARTFKDEEGNNYTMSAYYNRTDKEVIIYAGAYISNNNEPSANSGYPVTDPTPDGLTRFWKDLNGHTD